MGGCLLVLVDMGARGWCLVIVSGLSKPEMKIGGHLRPWAVVSGSRQITLQLKGHSQA